LNINGVSVDGVTGQLMWIGVPKDTPFLRTNPPPAEGDFEVHQATFRWTWLDTNSNLQRGSHKFFVTVERYLGDANTPGGSGPYTYSDQLVDQDNTPLPNVLMWATSDAAGDDVVAGSIRTDCDGYYAFHFQVGGTYYIWVDESQYQFAPNPAAVVATLG
jgi:hypothetical protein